MAKNKVVGEHNRMLKLLRSAFCPSKDWISACGHDGPSMPPGCQKEWNEIMAALVFLSRNEYE